MSKYAFLRSNGALVIVGLVLGLFGGFKIANSQYRSKQSESLNREVAQATGGMSGPQGDVKAVIDKARANPNDADAQVEAAIQFIQIERPQEALPFLEQARKVKPNDSHVSAGFGFAYFMLGQYDQATEWLKRSREQGADDPSVTSLLIGSYIRTGNNLDEADRLLKELETNGVDPTRLAQIREELNNSRSGGNSSPGAASAPNTSGAAGPKTVLSHGPEEPKATPAQPKGQSGGKN